MDIYGSFQICLTGVLSAPVTFKLSRIFYSRGPGRNTIILWTALLLSGKWLSELVYKNPLVMKPSFAGILSLLTEFLRAHPSSCTQDEHKNLISQDPAKFPYNTTCGLTCSVEKGPFSPLRKGSGNDIYVIPAPNKLTFGTATLFAAAGCVQVVLSLISMWGRQLEFNWKQRFVGAEESKAGGDIVVARKYKNGRELRRMYLRVISTPLFIAALLAFIVIGERNLFSSQLRYQTEPIASIGKLLEFSSVSIDC